MIFSLTASHQRRNGNQIKIVQMITSASKPNFPYYTVFTGVVFCSLILLGTRQGEAHEFEDGFADRTVRVLIRDRTATIEYSVGCNQNTMCGVLDHWCPPEASDDTNAAQNDTQDSNPAKTPANDLAVENRFQTELLAQIAKQLVVECDQQRVVLTPVSVARSPRHHVNAVATLKFEIPGSDSLELTIQDTMFMEEIGGVRLAAKSYGNVVMSRSNVAPTLVRAERQELAGLTSTQRREKSKIVCQLIFVSSEEK